jgi:hypothetical protein
VLTGYNTDIDFDGSVYHVQTEDKGLESGLVETLVYSSGEILYSRRTSYTAILEEGGDMDAVAEMMERQHRTIVEAIRRGLLDRLIRGEEGAGEADETAISRPAAVQTESGSERSLDQVILDYLEAQKNQDHLVLKAAAVQEFVYGTEVPVEVRTARSKSDEPVAGAQIQVVFKSTGEPHRLVLAEGTTDERGRFQAMVQLPPFNGGTSAVVITAESTAGRSEIKHLVHR